MLNTFLPIYCNLLHPFSSFIVFLSLPLLFSPSSLPEQGSGGNPGRAGEGEETADAESVHEHTWSQVGEGRCTALEANRSFLSENLVLFWKTYLLFSLLPSPPVASRCPDRAWRSSGTTQSSSTLLPSRKLPCRWDRKKMQLHLLLHNFTHST